MSKSDPKVKSFGISKGLVWEAYKRVKAKKGAVSAGGSNRAGQEVGEDFCWGSVAEDTPGSVVELAGDKIEVGLVVSDLGALGEVLAQQPVGVLVGAALPG